jgi:hypothetical protein
MNRPYDTVPRDADDELKRQWRAQPRPEAEFDVEDIRRAANRLRRRVAMRNANEYLACGVIALVFAFVLVTIPFPLVRIGSALVIAGAFVVAWQLHARTSAQPGPVDCGAQSWVDHHRAQLVRQRDALRTAAAWYIGPLVPGVVVFRWGMATELGGDAPLARVLFDSLVVAAIFFAVIFINRRAARKLQQRIDLLDLEAR